MRILRSLACLAHVWMYLGCEPVPINRAVACKKDTDCVNPYQCISNVCRRKTVPTAGVGALTMKASAAAGSVARSAAPGTSGQSTMPAPKAASANTPSSGTAGTGGATSPSVHTTETAGAPGAAPDPAVVVMCPADACMPGGTCVQGAKDYTCSCQADYLPSDGLKRCLKIDDCPSRACVPGGKCIDGVNDFMCECDPGYEGTGTKNCKGGDGGTPAAGSGTCPADACSPGGECQSAAGDYTCKCSVELRMPDPKACPLVDKGDGTLFDVKRNLTWQKAIGTTPKGFLSPADDASTAMRYCSAVTQPAATWRVPTAEELRSLPALATDRHACFGTTSGVICNDVAVESGQTTPANMIDMRCVH